VATAYPAPSSVGTSSRMRATPQHGTKPERAVRSAVHRRGLRYRVDSRPLPDLRRRADLVFPRVRVAVFVDGCYWHGCPEHVTWPASNADWWRAKIKRNRERDLETDRLLQARGWAVVRAWEHEDPEVVADRVERTVRLRGPSSSDHQRISRARRPPSSGSDRPDDRISG
jgi:DNA mismatch endonuclease, patch repair protein